MDSILETRIKRLELLAAAAQLHNSGERALISTTGFQGPNGDTSLPANQTTQTAVSAFFTVPSGTDKVTVTGRCTIKNASGGDGRIAINVKCGNITMDLIDPPVLNGTTIVVPFAATLAPGAGSYVIWIWFTPTVNMVLDATGGLACSYYTQVVSA